MIELVNVGHVILESTYSLMPSFQRPHSSKVDMGIGGQVPAAEVAYA